MNIIEVWYRLGGPKLRGLRGIAWWREGSKFSVQLFPGATKVQFRDYGESGEWGDCARLVMIVKGYDYKEALAWLGEETPAYREDPEWEEARDWRRGMLRIVEDQMADLGIREVRAGNLQRRRINHFIPYYIDLRDYYAALAGTPLLNEYRLRKQFDGGNTWTCVKYGRLLAQMNADLKQSIHEYVADVCRPWISCHLCSGQGCSDCWKGIVPPVREQNGHIERKVASVAA